VDLCGAVHAVGEDHVGGQQFLACRCIVANAPISSLEFFDLLRERGDLGPGGRRGGRGIHLEDRITERVAGRRDAFEPEGLVLAGGDVRMLGSLHVGRVPARGEPRLHEGGGLLVDGVDAGLKGPAVPCGSADADNREKREGHAQRAASHVMSSTGSYYSSFTS
jgi:hypothetical protein